MTIQAFPKLSSYTDLEGPITDKYVNADPETARTYIANNVIAASLPGLQACTPSHVLILTYVYDEPNSYPILSYEYKNTICSAAIVTGSQAENSIFTVQIPKSQQLQQIDRFNQAEDRDYVFVPKFIKTDSNIFDEGYNKATLHISESTNSTYHILTVQIYINETRYTPDSGTKIMIEYFAGV